MGILHQLSMLLLKPVSPIYKCVIVNIKLQGQLLSFQKTIRHILSTTFLFSLCQILCICIVGNMEKSRLLSLILRLITHLCLFIFFVKFYLIEEMGDYIADRVTTTSRFEEVVESEFPTITICMDPPQKQSVAKMYGFQSVIGINMIDVPNTTLSERFEATSYILKKDFSIKVYIVHSTFYKKFDLKIGVNGPFLIEPIVTWYHGICYKMEPKFKITNVAYVSFRFYLNKNNTDQPNDLLMYLTSPNATLNLAMSVWPQYAPAEVKLPLDTTKKTDIQYQTVQHTFKTGTENASQCVTDIIENSTCNSCSSISGSSLPICNSTKDVQCILRYYPQWQKCLLQKRTVAYVPQKNEILRYGKNTSAVIVQVFAFTNSKQIMEEIDVITLSGLIGSVGGSLGMFFGFSITSYLSLVIEKLSRKVFSFKNVGC